MVRRARVAEAELQRWAKSSGYRIIKVEERFVRKGPFIWGSGKGDFVSRILVEAEDEPRLGWARFRVGMLPMFGCRLDILWDQPSPLLDLEIDGGVTAT